MKKKKKIKDKEETFWRGPRRQKTKSLPDTKENKMKMAYSIFNSNQLKFLRRLLRFFRFVF